MTGAVSPDECKARIRARLGIGSPTPHEAEALLWSCLVEVERRFLCRFAGIAPARADIAWALIKSSERARLLIAWERVEMLVSRVKARKISRLAGGPECRQIS